MRSSVLLHSHSVIRFYNEYYQSKSGMTGGVAPDLLHDTCGGKAALVACTTNDDPPQLKRKYIMCPLLYHIFPVYISGVQSAHHVHKHGGDLLWRILALWPVPLG